MWAFCLVVAVLLAQVPAEPAPTTDANQQAVAVRRLVRQLDSPRLTERQAAEEELIRLGSPVLELLPSATDQLSAEVQQRLARIRQKLQKQLTASFAEPTRVTLKGDAIPLSKVLDEVRKQTGNPVSPQPVAEGAPDKEPTLKLDFDKTPFWTAIDQVARQAKLKVYPYGEEPGLQLMFRPPNETTRPNLVSYSNAFRFEVARVLARRVFRVTDSGALDLTIEASWEPRLSPIALDQSIAAIQAVDEDGKPLRVAQQRAKLEVPVAGQAKAVEFQIPFELPARSVKRIAKLRGTLGALLPGKIETFRFDNLPAASDVQKRVGSATVTLQQVRKNNEIWEVRVRIGYDESHGAMASHRTWMFANEAYLESPQGEKVAYDSFESTSQSENEYGVAYLFALEKPLDQYVFVYKTAGVILSAQFTYEFSDLELP